MLDHHFLLLSNSKNANFGMKVQTNEGIIFPHSSQLLPIKCNGTTIFYFLIFSSCKQMDPIVIRRILEYKQIYVTLFWKDLM